MNIPKYGMLQELSLRYKFIFNSFDNICWQHKQEMHMGVVLYLPLTEGMPKYLLEYMNQWPQIYCDLNFVKEDKKIQVIGNVLKHQGLTVEIEEQGQIQKMLIVELPEKESIAFMQMITWKKTQMLQQANRSKQTKVEKSKRRYERIPKKFKITYNLTIPKVDLETGRGMHVETIQMSGETLNISKNGIFVKSQFLPPLYAKLQVRVMADNGKIIEACGQVVRRQSDQPNSGFALELLPD